MICYYCGPAHAGQKCPFIKEPAVKQQVVSDTAIAEAARRFRKFCTEHPNEVATMTYDANKLLHELFNAIDGKK